MHAGRQVGCGGGVPSLELPCSRLLKLACLSGLSKPPFALTHSWHRHTCAHLFLVLQQGRTPVNVLVLTGLFGAPLGLSQRLLPFNLAPQVGLHPTTKAFQEQGSKVAIQHTDLVP